MKYPLKIIKREARVMGQKLGFYYPLEKIGRYTSNEYVVVEIFIIITFKAKEEKKYLFLEEEFLNKANIHELRFALAKKIVELGNNYPLITKSPSTIKEVVLDMDREERVPRGYRSFYNRLYKELSVDNL